MTAQVSKAVAVRFFEELWNKGNLMGTPATGKTPTVSG